MRWTRRFSRLVVAWFVLAALAAGCAHSVAPVAPTTPAPTELIPTGEVLYPVNPGVRPGSEACGDQVMRYGAAQPEWAEAYVSGFRFVANFTGNVAKHVAAIRDLVGPDCAVFVQIVPYTAAECRALQDRIWNDKAILRAAGVELNMVGFNSMKDRVEVGVVTLTDQVRAELLRRYPNEMITIEEFPEPIPA